MQIARFWRGVLGEKCGSSCRAGAATPGRIVTTVYNGQPDPYSGGAIASGAE